MKTKGFAWSPALLVIAVALAVGGGVYWYGQATSATQSADQSELGFRPVNDSFAVGSNAVPLDPPYGCYAKTPDAVYKEFLGDVSSASLSDKAQLVTGADPNSFKEIVPYGRCFGKDKNHVYKDTAALAWADPTTFELLWYSKPGPILLFRNGAKIVRYDVATGAHADVERGDPDTFTTILGSYDFAPWAKDKNQVYCHGDPILYSDPSTTIVSADSTTIKFNTNGIDRVYDSECRWLQSNNLSATPLAGKAPLHVHFVAQPSAGEEYISFGDGTVWRQDSESTEVDHTYTVPGTYVVQLYRSFPSIQIGEVRITVTQ
jgi:hypothetical protein